LWQCLYLSQFFALEFFFRGFIIHGIKKRFGFYSIFVMMIPYVMIHFQKPMPETFGAVLAGVVLGTLSLKSRSIWLGVAIHYAVAITMDLTALWQKGYFG
jgi:membrane protease YdiL (CAAX protease family)